MDDKSRQKGIQLNEYEHLLDTASVWLVRMDEGLDSTQKIQLKQWLEQPRHRAVLLEMAALWDKMDALSQLWALWPARPTSSAWFSNCNQSGQQWQLQPTPGARVHSIRAHGARKI